MISQHDSKCDLLFLYQGPEPSSSEGNNLGLWWEDVIEDEVVTDKVSALEVSMMKNDSRPP